jgi:hypothetical protein
MIFDELIAREPSRYTPDADGVRRRLTDLGDDPHQVADNLHRLGRVGTHRCESCPVALDLLDVFGPHLTERRGCIYSDPVLVDAETVTVMFAEEGLVNVLVPHPVSEFIDRYDRRVPRFRRLERAS